MMDKELEIRIKDMASNLETYQRQCMTARMERDELARELKELKSAVLEYLTAEDEAAITGWDGENEEKTQNAKETLWGFVTDIIEEKQEKDK